jgi:hypothetical protein
MNLRNRTKCFAIVQDQNFRLLIESAQVRVMIKNNNHDNFVGLTILAGVMAVGFLSLFSKPAQAAEQFSTKGVQFEADTIVEFEFVESHGAYQSTFGVINLDTGEKTPLLAEVKPSDNLQNVSTPSDYRRTSKDDFTGTPGNTVPKPLAEFYFKANQRYVFYLESTHKGRPAGIVYSTNSQNLGGNQQAKFDGEISGLANGGTITLWDDTGSALVKPNQNDLDFNDFIVRAGGHLACPYANNNRSQTKSLGGYKLGAGLKCTGK